ncbi:hypothetical protein BD324DRAFT_653541 [Kockovaella imperatae]|uniref:Large ribosomal subunit protein uL30m n=1 Tax=Kockovaella imperatae TaxID=4999 RepID=A0A1Y1U8D2_9TREE|nr:hypothetical protein BD324DRAFT_653541 [Kockovaella imperatae]ORX34272.1 hypothetical protein BD324DRAFT_653541 [Kockovaella imperatae]
MIVRTAANIGPSRVLYGVRTIASSSTSSTVASSSSSPAASTSRQSSPPRQSSSSSLKSPTAQSQSPPKTHHFVKLVRSTIGLQQVYKDTVRSLGLKRRHSVALVPFNKGFGGMLIKVKELIEVRNVTKQEGLDLLRRTKDRSEGAGVVPTGLAFGGSRSKSVEGEP